MVYYPAGYYPPGYFAPGYFAEDASGGGLPHIAQGFCGDLTPDGTNAPATSGASWELRQGSTVVATNLSPAGNTVAVNSDGTIHLCLSRTLTPNLTYEVRLAGSGSATELDGV